MSHIPADLRYASTHEWARLESDGTVTVGITEHAQEALGDVVYLDLPDIGRKLHAGDACATIESVKAASDIHAPVSGEIFAVNAHVADAPEKVNTAPYDSWLFRIRPDAPDLSGLLDAEGYAREIG